LGQRAPGALAPIGRHATPRRSDNVKQFRNPNYWYTLRRRLAYRARWNALTRAMHRAADAAKPYGVISGGTDCDGMRYASASLHWTAAGAVAAREWAYEGAEGPCGAVIVSGTEAREWRRAYEPDTRDRFAEAMGY
jgi:hypothetical protein